MTINIGNLHLFFTERILIIFALIFLFAVIACKLIDYKAILKENETLLKLK